MTELEKVNEDVEQFFRKEFAKVAICDSISDKIINAIISYCADPSETFSLNIENYFTPGQEATVQKLISMFLNNFKYELENMRFRNSLN